MKGTTHILGGIAAAAIAQNQFNLGMENTIIYYSTAVIGAIIPDICHPNSMIGRRLPILSKVFSSVFGHRSFTHSLLFFLLVFILTEQFTFEYAQTVQAGILVGIGSHIVLDALTARGVKLLYPLKVNIRSPLFVRTGSLIGESLVVVGLLTLMVMTFFVS
ncbi:metal-dependent hydrolase [Halalkalibacter krulwichiae]|uniref:Inner membrane protein YdjM n=1 Tax=Halalkalibacter krulwichiae TaxID=199441 RepID=A0A1X9MAJ5_9BACI|nr:metal-dependent hydrolase [Halalkalibacter krulwichiae]ARK30456.1 Inner membrane protein YdjM [Halalkalibacter krulwichiae]